MVCYGRERRGSNDVHLDERRWITYIDQDIGQFSCQQSSKSGNLLEGNKTLGSFLPFFFFAKFLSIRNKKYKYTILLPNMKHQESYGIYQNINPKVS